MKKAICPKCHQSIDVDESVTSFNCPLCNEFIFTNAALKEYYRTISNYRHAGDLCFSKKGDYVNAFKSYEALFKYINDDLTILSLLVMSKLRSSNLDQVTIKDATELLLSGSDNIEITYDNVMDLSDFLIKVREDSKVIVDTLLIHKNESTKSLNLFKQAVDEYIYFLKSYLSIYDALDKLSQYFKDSKELINEEINKASELLNKEVNNVSIAKNNNREIFPNKLKSYYFHLGLLGVTLLGFVLSIVGLILLTTTNDLILKTTILTIGLFFFIGGYFLNHYLTYTLPNKKKVTK